MIHFDMTINTTGGWETLQTECVFSGFRHESGEICALLRLYTMYSGKFLPTFRDNLSVDSSSLKMGPIGRWVVPKIR